MKLLVINDYAEPAGGASMVAIMQAEAMAARGHEVVLFSAVSGAQLQRNGVRYVGCAQHDLLTHPQRAVAAMQGIWNRSVAAKLRQLLVELGDDGWIAHLHSWSKALSSSVLPVLRQAGVPIVCTLHDSFVACPNGGFYDYRRGETCARMPMSLSCIACNCDARNYGHKLWRLGRQVVQRQIGGLPAGIDRFITVSDFSRRLLAPYLPATVPVTVVSTPIVMPQQSPLPRAERTGAVFVGRMAPEKGVSLYVGACQRAAVTPQFLGDGELAAWVREQHGEVDISGWLSVPALRQRLASALLLVFPTRAYEAQPLSVLEAAALGVPFIVSAHCAAAEYVRASDGGLLLQSDSPDELAALMRRVMDDREEWSRLSANAYRWFWASEYAQPEPLYRRLEQEYRALQR